MKHSPLRRVSLRKKVKKKIVGSFAKPRGRPLKITVKARKNSAWTVFARYIRTKAIKEAGNNGVAVCYTCGVSTSDIQAGHGIGGRNNAVLFMEAVVKPQCERCNGYLGGNYKVFTLKLIKELGAEKFEELLIESNRVDKMTPMEFLEIEKTYKLKLAELE